MKYSFLGAFFAFFIVGCGVWGKVYVSPTNGPLASITFTTTDRQSTLVEVVRYTGEEFLEHKGESVAWLGKVRLVDKGDKVKIMAKANEEFRFTIRNNSGERINNNLNRIDFCITHLGFVPVAGENYIIQNGLLGSEGCVTEVLLLKSDGLMIPVESVRYYPSCIDPNLLSKASLNTCSPDFKFR
jgi:hypothetical protein